MFASECTPNSRSPSRTTFQRYNEFGGPVCLCTLQQDARVCCRLISSSLRPNVLRKVKQKNISARRRPRCDSWPSATLTVSTTAVRVRSCACVCYFTHRPRFSFLQSWLSECHTVLVRCPATAHTPFPGAPCDARFQQCGEIDRERETLVRWRFGLPFPHSLCTPPRRSLPQCIITVDGSPENVGTILSVNPAATRAFGYTKWQLERRNIAMLIPQPIAAMRKSWRRGVWRPWQPKCLTLTVAIAPLLPALPSPRRQHDAGLPDPGRRCVRESGRTCYGL